jgi:hypothetical protein
MTPSAREGGLDPPFVRLVMPGVFEHWMRYHGKWGGQNKMPRCRSDRLIADELGEAPPIRKRLAGWHGQCCNRPTCAKQGFG